MVREPRFFKDEAELGALIRKNMYYVPTASRVDIVGPEVQIGAAADWNPKENKIRVSAGGAVLDTRTWFLLTHEKGHAERYPRYGFDDYVARAIVSCVMRNKRLEQSIQSPPTYKDEKHMVVTPTMHEICNFIEDSMIHAHFLQTKSLENSDWYLTNASILRYMHEAPLGTFPSNVDETVYPDIFVFHGLIQTSLAWLYMATKEPEDSPLRHFFETTCTKCNNIFVTIDYRCPRCQTWNLTDEQVPDILFLKDPRSILVEKSESKRVQWFYKTLRDYFIHLIRISYFSNKYPAGKSETRNVFSRVAYTPLAEMFCGLINGGFYFSYGDVETLKFPAFLKKVAGDDVEMLRCMVRGLGGNFLMERYHQSSSDTSLKMEFQKRTGEDFDDSLPPAEGLIRPVFRGRNYFSPDDDMHNDPLFRLVDEIVVLLRGGPEILKSRVFEVLQTGSEDLQKQWAMAFALLGQVEAFAALVQEAQALSASGGASL